MMRVPVRAGPSPIDGLGVIAIEPIRRDTLVWELTEGLDLVIPEATWPHFGDVRDAYLERYAYFDQRRRSFVLCCDDARYMNHADDPNVSDTIDDRCFALRDIERGEELTCNYHRLDARPMRFSPNR